MKQPKTRNKFYNYGTSGSTKWRIGNHVVGALEKTDYNKYISLNFQQLSTKWRRGSHDPDLASVETKTW